jgi:hypothetical protein
MTMAIDENPLQIYQAIKDWKLPPQVSNKTRVLNSTILPNTVSFNTEVLGRAISKKEKIKASMLE